MSERKLMMFLSGWFVLAVVQAAFTDLANDEAYYWMYSQKLDWGYFDHPPVVALFIKAGYLLFQNELGVRLVTILSQVLALYLFYRFLLPEETKQRNTWSAFIIIALVPMIHVYSFIATPDAPIFLGAVLFLIAYKNFLSEDSINRTLLLGVSMTFMLYAKYHGLLIIVFVLLSNPSLLLNKKFWIASVFGASLFVPHLLWQYHNDFPSLKYHLVERNRTFQIKHLIAYLYNQLINFNPVILVVVLMNAFRSKIPTEKFERSLYFTMMGFFIFFLIMTWRGHVEPQWTYVLAIPILYFALRYASAIQEKAMLYSAYFIFTILIAARVLLIFDFVPKPTEFHGYKSLVSQLKEEADGLPVFVVNNYQLASKYAFYSGDPCMSINSGARHNQYDLWSDEEQYLGKKVFLVSRSPREGFIDLNVSGLYPAFGRVVDDFTFYKSIKFSWDAPDQIRGQEFRATLTVYNPYQRDVEIGNHARMIIFLTDSQNVKSEIALDAGILTIKAKEITVIDVTAKLDVPTGEYSIRFGLWEEDQLFSQNSQVYKVEISN